VNLKACVPASASYLALLMRFPREFTTALWVSECAKKYMLLLGYCANSSPEKPLEVPNLEWKTTGKEYPVAYSFFANVSLLYFK
jgi:hypothetical protein